MLAYIKLKPSCYYKFRESNENLKIRYLEDKIGTDKRYSFPPYCETYISIIAILKYQKEFIENVHNGDKMLNILKEITKECKNDKEIIDFFWSLNNFWVDCFNYEIGELNGFLISKEKFDSAKYKSTKFWEE